MDKLRRKRTSKVKNKKEADPSNAKLSTTHKFIISIALGGGGIVRGLLKAGCGAESSYEHHYIHHRRGW